MSQETVSSVYKWVIDDVIDKISLEFAQLGVDESILQELQQSWEQRLISSKILALPSSSYGDNYPSASNAPAHLNSSNTSFQNNPARQRGMPDLTAAYYQLNQNDGTQESGAYADSIILTVINEKEHEHTEELDARAIELEAAIKGNARFSTRPHKLRFDFQVSKVDAIKRRNRSKLEDVRLVQVDGLDDDEDDDDDDNDDEEEEADIGSDLDDDEEEEEVETEHIILCQYDKVTRIKNKWKATLRDGVMTINGKDYLFSKANGEFEW